MVNPLKRDSEIEKAVLKLLEDFGEIQRSSVVTALSKKFSEQALNQTINRLVQLKRIMEFKDLLRPKPQ